MDLAALLVSVVALLVGGGFSYQANTRAKEADRRAAEANRISGQANELSERALADARDAAASALWSDVQVAVQRFLGFDPSTEPVGDRLVQLRTAAIALVDGLGDAWEGLDVWLATEHQLGPVLARELMESVDPSDTIDQRLAKMNNFSTWAIALSQNLRFLRSTGYDRTAIAELARLARVRIEQVSDQHGWPRPPTELPPSIQPLSNEPHD